MKHGSLPPDLEETLTELAIDTDLPRDVVEKFIADHSEYRPAILRYAIDWHATQGKEDSDEDVTPLPDPVLPTIENGPIADPFANRSAGELKKVASDCDIPVLILSKIEQRTIRAQSIPLLLVRNLATALGTGVSSLLRFLELSATLSPDVSYRSDQNPEVGNKIDFATAIKQMKMDEAQRARWLSLIE